MKVNSKIILAFGFIAILVIIIISLRPNSRLLLTLLPPADLYSHVVINTITLQEKLACPPFILKHKYVGTYLIGLYIENPPPDPYGTAIETNAKLRLSINDGQHEIFEKTFTRWANRFGEPGDNEAGVILGHYKVPEDIPLNDKVVSTISVESIDSSFEAKFGKAKFFIRRTPDL